MPASFPNRAVLVVVAVVALSLPTALAASPLAGAGSSLPQAAPTGGGLVAQLWSWVAALWPGNGCGIDPNGRCATAPKPRPDNGCGADPDGRCTTAAPAPKPRPDNGCGIDPSGQYASAASLHRSSPRPRRP